MSQPLQQSPGHRNWNRGTAALLLATAVGFSYMIVDASLGESVLDGLRTIAASDWGLVTLADLGIGLVFAAVWMVAVAGVRAWPWVLALFLLGNLTLLVFLLMRLRRFHAPRELLLEPDPRG